MKKTAYFVIISLVIFCCIGWTPGATATTPLHSDSRYEVQTLNDAKVVIDHANGLMWQQSGAYDEMSWEKATDYVNQLNQKRYAGFSDWRLPTIEELKLLLEPTKKSGDLHIAPVFDTTQTWCWSADKDEDTSKMWFIKFTSNVVELAEPYLSRNVRAVRLVGEKMTTQTEKETSTPLVSDTKKEQPEASQPEKTVRIVIDQSFTEDRNNNSITVRNLFESVTRELLEYAGLKVVSSEDQKSDFTLKIRATGKAYGNEYTFWMSSKSGYYYTGASLKGNISLELSGVQISETSFSGSISPPFNIKEHQASPAASGAPFRQVLKEPGSFISQLIEMLGEVYGTQFLIPALRDYDSEIRESAAKILYRVSNTAAVEPLLAALKDEKVYIRKTAAHVLGKLKDPRSIEPLIVALKDENSEVRKNAARALEQMGEAAIDPLIVALKDEDAYVRKSAVQALGATKDPRAVDPLIAALKDEDAEVREIATKALEKMGETVINSLIVALDSEDAYVRKSAVQALGATKDPRAVDPLIAALKDEDAEVRESAVEALEKLEDPQVIEALIVALKDEDAEVRESAVKAMEKIGEPAVESLIAVLQDSDFNIRFLAAGALGKIKDLRAVEPLIAALQDEEFIVQAKVAEALGKIQDPRAVKPLIDIMNEGNAFVQKHVVEALKKITKQSFGDDYKAWLTWWEEHKE